MFDFNFENIADDSPLADGVYYGEIVDSEAATSKTGNHMIKIKILVKDKDSNKFINDYFVNGNEIATKRLRSLVYSAGRKDLGGITSDDQIMGFKIKMNVAVDGNYNRVDSYIDEEKDILF